MLQEGTPWMRTQRRQRECLMQRDQFLEPQDLLTGSWSPPTPAASVSQVTSTPGAKVSLGVTVPHDCLSADDFGVNTHPHCPPLSPQTGN